MDHLETAIPGDPSHNQPPNLTQLHMPARFCWKDPDIAVFCETMPVPGKYRSGYSQSSIWWNTGLPMEELEKVPKILKGSATLYVEQKYELSSTPRAHVSSCIRSRRWPSRPSVEREAHWSCTLYMPQLQGNDRAKKWEWGVSVWGTFGIALEI